MLKNKYLLVALAVLAGLAIYLVLKNQKSTLETKSDAFAIQDTSLITKIFLGDRLGNKVNLIRKSPGNWTVDDKFAANEIMLETLLGTMKNVRIKNPLPEAAVKNVLKDLAATSIKVEIYGKEGLLKAYYVGNSTENGLGTVMMLEDADKPIVTYIPGFDGFLSSRFYAESAIWKSKIIFRYQPGDIKNVRLTYLQHPDQSLNIAVKDKNSFEVSNLATGKPLSFNNVAISEYLSLYSRVGAFDFPEPVIKDSILNAGNFAEIAVTNQRGEENKVNIYFAPNVDGSLDSKGRLLPFSQVYFYCLINKGKDFASAQTNVLNKLLITAENLK